jgi:hypothetical protein
MITSLVLDGLCVSEISLVESSLVCKPNLQRKVGHHVHLHSHPPPKVQRANDLLPAPPDSYLLPSQGYGHLSVDRASWRHGYDCRSSRTTVVVSQHYQGSSPAFGSCSRCPIRLDFCNVPSGHHQDAYPNGPSKCIAP